MEPLNGHAERNGVHKPVRRPAQKPLPGKTIPETLLSIVVRLLVLGEGNPDEPVWVTFKRGKIEVKFCIDAEDLNRLVQLNQLMTPAPAGNLLTDERNPTP